MRSTTEQFRANLRAKAQTTAASNNPSLDLRITRPTTALTESAFIETQAATSKAVTDASIAVSHPGFGASNDMVYIAYIESGTARIISAKSKVKMSAHVWNEESFSQTADSISIAFDGTMPKNTKGNIEFVTEEYPWVFWTDSGALYGQQLYANMNPVTLAESNCTDVSAIRAMWSLGGGFDFGLVVFFIVNGYLYYRQYIKGTWYDAEAVTDSVLPTNGSYTECAAFRTWDYRIGVQAKDSSGNVYELFTQYMGIAKQLEEHIEANVSAESKLTAIKYTNTAETEHIKAVVSANGTLLYAFSSAVTSAENVADEFDNWGIYVVLAFDYPISAVSGNASNFMLSDTDGNEFACTDLSLSDDGLTLTLTCLDFNLSADKDITVTYTAGTIKSPAKALDSFTYTFTPTNLDPVWVNAPKVVDIWNE